MKKNLKMSLMLMIGFVVWTYLVQIVDVRIIGESLTSVGFSLLNEWFFNFTGVHMLIYYVTDWLSLIPLGVCLFFGVIGLIQLIKRKNIFKVDYDILVLGFYYILVISIYILFEIIPINYRPILINGIKEVSYPSSTTLLVLSVMLSLSFQIKRRMPNNKLKTLALIINGLFCVFMVGGRAISGVHWLSDIIGSLMLSFGLYHLYKAIVFMKKEGD